MYKLRPQGTLHQNKNNNNSDFSTTQHILGLETLSAAIQLLKHQTKRR